MLYHLLHEIHRNPISNIAFQNISLGRLSKNGMRGVLGNLGGFGESRGGRSRFAGIDGLLIGIIS